MPRPLLAFFSALALFASACHHSATEDPEPAGPLEGTWRVTVTDPVMYDAQNNVLVTFSPTTGATDYTQLRFTATDLEEYNDQTNGRYTMPYVRSGDAITCPAPWRSYTIRKLTTRHLDLYQRGEYIQTGALYSRTDYTIHLDRQ